MRVLSPLRLVSLAALALSVAGCSVGHQLCAKRQECNDSLEDDSYAVCVESYNAGISELRANQEPECQRRADAQLAFDACVATLDCDDIEDGDFDDCDDERDDLNDAIEDSVSRGDDQCSRFN